MKTILINELSVPDMYKWMVSLVVPRPIGWIATYSKDGVPNLAPYSFFNVLSNNPPVIGFCASLTRDGKKKDSLVNCEETGFFTHNVVTEDLAEAMNQSSFEYPHGVSEFEKTGLTLLPSEKVKAPRIKEAAVTLECKVDRIISFGDKPTNGQVVCGEVVAIHIQDEKILSPDGFPDFSKFRVLSRMGGVSYLGLDGVREIPRPKTP